MIKIAIIEDDFKDRSLLLDYFKQLQNEVHEEINVSDFETGDRFLNQNDGTFDLICLDISMPGRDGYNTAKEIRKKDEDVIIVFITNMAQMAIRGYEVHALDFVLKPVNYYSFAMKMRSAINIIKKQKNKNILLSTQDQVIKINADELYYVEVRDHYLYYHTVSGNYKQKATLTELESKLTGLPFVRSNNCYLVNLKYVDRIEKDELLVAGDWLKISRPRKKELLKSLANYMGGIT